MYFSSLFHLFTEKTATCTGDVCSSQHVNRELKISFESAEQPYCM